MNTLLKTNPQLHPWLSRLKFLALATSMTVGLTVSESVWAGCNAVTLSGPPVYTYYECNGTGHYFVLSDCQAACVSTPQYTLTLNTTGTGSGTVSGGGSFPEGTKVDLVATPAADSTFAGWSSGCSSGMTLMANTTCTATFNKGDSTTPTTTPTTSFTPSLPEKLSIFLQVAGTGHGKVTTNTGLFCQTSDCQVDIESGGLKCNPQNCTQLEKTTSEVTLTPQADSDSVFSSWGGNEDCVDGQVLMNGGKLCIAYFRRTYSLKVATQGAGSVSGYGYYTQKSLIDCGSTCQVPWVDGMKVVLEAWPAAGMIFKGWSGDCNSLEEQLIVPFNEDMSCQATFIDPSTVVSQKQDQTITNFSPVTPAAMGEAILAAIGGASNNPVTFTSITPEVCTVSGETVTLKTAGTCV